MDRRQGIGVAMMSDAESLLRELLPAGEWAEVTVVQAPDGMMGSRAWALLARARSIRSRRAAFIKLILAAPKNAGPETALVTGAERLKAMAFRLQQFRTDSTLPVVEVLATYQNDRGLLIAMENVSTVHALLANEALNGAEVSRLLRELSPSPSWVHFDICPRNIGRNERGQYVLIDLDSIYTPERSGYAISVPAYKPQRLARAIDVKVLDGLAASGGLPSSVALRKYTYELLLAALEALVRADAIPLMNALNQARAVDWVLDDLVAKHPGAGPVAEALVACAAGGEVNLEAVAVAVERGGRSARAANVSTLPAVQADVARGESTEADPPIGSSWPSEVRELSRRMRADQLTRDELRGYANMLEGVLASSPEDASLWLELQYLHIGYLRDMAQALLVTRRFIERHPDNHGAQRWEQVLRMQVVPSQPRKP